MALTEEQLKARKIGGSDVATILGMNPHKTPLELYAEARGEIEPANLDDNDAVFAGTNFEDAIAKFAERCLTRREGREIKLRRIKKTQVNPKWPWLTVHIDRDIVGEERGVEIKNVGRFTAKDWGKPGTDEIPEYYLPQVHTYMLVMEYPSFVTAAYFGGSDLGLYDVPASKAFSELIVEETHHFWHNHVLAGVPPEFDAAHPGAAQAIRRVYTGTSGEIVKATDVLEHYKAVWQHEEKLLKEAEMASEIAKNRLVRFMENATILQFKDGTELRRKQINVKDYHVAAKSYIEARLVKPKGKKKSDTNEGDDE